MTEKRPLRSQAWFARQDKMGFYYRSWLKNREFPQDQFEGRPVIGICNTWSELTLCNSLSCANIRSHDCLRERIVVM
jgi:L-arabonate dehydrase